MEATFERKELAAALRIAQMVRENRSTMPILQCAHLQFIGDKVTIAATNVQDYVSIEVPCKPSEDGEIMLPIDKALAFAQAASTDKIKISFTNARATMTAGKSRATLATIDPAGWPKHDMGELKPVADIGGAKLASMVGAVAWITGLQKSAMGAAVPVNRFMAIDGSLNVASFGAHALALAHSSVLAELDVQIAATSAQMIARIFSDSETVTISAHASGLVFDGDGISFMARQVQGAAPSFAPVLTAEFPNVAKVFPASTLATMAQVTPFAQSLKDKYDPYIDLTFDVEELTMACAGDGGDASAANQCNYSGKKATMRMASSYLESALKACAGIDVAFSWNKTGVKITDGLSTQIVAMRAMK